VRMKHARAGDRPSFDDEAITDFVDHDEVECAGTFGKSPRDGFMVDDRGAEHGSVMKPCVEIGLLKTSREASAQLRGATSE
jgi:hypothetical protein